MGDPLKKVQAGAPLVVPATAWNAFIDAAEDFQRRQHDQSARTGRQFRESGIVPLKNASGSDSRSPSLLRFSKSAPAPSGNGKPGSCRLNSLRRARWQGSPSATELNLKNHEQKRTMPRGF